jgi:hypothetical protein
MAGIILELAAAAGDGDLLAALGLAGRILLGWTLVSFAAGALWSLAAVSAKRRRVRA